ncbi:CD209 antigen-like protein E [Toxotes jaculatrix]|uniref:CD209 antigen-like protein E n=1 Tax=Toxotes jaculatrix TaxID=941984 RepID=UPI001B3B0817|nr:CD209 antigen-like protein E [Toxotes jaculatrix]
MEEIYVNTEDMKSFNQSPSTSPPGPRSSDRRFHGGVVLSLVLLSLFLLAGAIVFFVLYQTSTAYFSIIKANLTEQLQASNIKFSSLSEERDLLNTNLTEVTEELNRIQRLFRQKGTCPAGWRKFCGACYLVSTNSDSWGKARQDCRDRGADLVVIDSAAEQTFLSNLVEDQIASWIGLTDVDEEKTWKWIDGTPLTLSYWAETQPDNGGGDPKWGEEDCAHLRAGKKTENNWNDLSCNASLQWICEKVA